MLARGLIYAFVLCVAAPRSVAAAVTVVEHLQVKDAASPGEAGTTYQLQSGPVSGTAPYVDRPFTFASALPRAVADATLIQTADADADVAAGSDAFVSFTVARSAQVYVGHDVTIGQKPDWLTHNFLDTGQEILVGNDVMERLELYVNAYPAGATVTLGANLGAGHTSASGRMYSVFVVPTPSDTTPPTPPANLTSACATASVVGLQWKAATDNVGVEAYRIVRDGSNIAALSPMQTAYADTAAAHSRSHTYTVVAVDGAGNASASKALRVRTRTRPAAAEPAYCPSSTITSMKFHFASAYSETSGDGPDNPPYSDGSDLWPLTVGADGNTYTFFGDGWGLCGQLDTDPGSHQDYTSFGFARIIGRMPLRSEERCPAQLSGGNIHGGYRAARPYGGGKNGLVEGKMGALIAVGSTFYGLGGIWRPADSGGPRSSPDHWDIVYSNDGGLTWQPSSWTFCSNANSPADPPPAFAMDGGRGICPSGFVNFGPGNAGALDEYVYLYATDNNPVLWGKPGPNYRPDKTYLLRVPADRLLDPGAYRYFAGTDRLGEPLWSELAQRRRAVFADSNPPRQVTGEGSQHAGVAGTVHMYMSLTEAVYVAPLGRFIATAQGQKVGQLAFYEAAKPWGPWSVIYYSNIDPARGGRGGWGNLGAGTWDGTRFSGADSLGVHIGTGWTSTDGKTLWLVFSSVGKAPQNARFKQLAGKWLDSFNMVEAKLHVRASP